MLDQRVSRCEESQMMGNFLNNMDRRIIHFFLTSHAFHQQRFSEDFTKTDFWF